MAIDPDARPHGLRMASVLTPTVRSSHAQSPLPLPLSPVSPSKSQDPRRTQSAGALSPRSPQSSSSTLSPPPSNANSLASTFGRAMSGTLFGSSPRESTGGYTVVTVVYCEPGPLYVDLFSRPDGKGAYVKSFRRRADGALGTAEAHGGIRINDELYQIEDLVLTELPFSAIVQAAKNAKFPLTLTFRCRVDSMPPMSPAKSSGAAGATSWSVKFGQLMAETGLSSAGRSSSSSSMNGGGGMMTDQPPSPRIIDKVRTTGTDGVKNLLRMMGGKPVRHEDDQETVSAWLSSLTLQPEAAAHSIPSSTTSPNSRLLLHSTPIAGSVPTTGRLMALDDPSEFHLQWYRKSATNDLVPIKNVRLGRYVPSVDDVGSVLALHCLAVRFPHLETIVETKQPLALDPAVGDMVDVLLEAGAASFSATLASNETDSFQIKITTDLLVLSKISEDEADAGVVASVRYNRHVQVLLEPSDDLRFTLKVQEFGGLLGLRAGEKCEMRKKSQLASLSCFVLVAQNPQHRDIVALLIRKLRAKVLPAEEEEQAREDELNLFMDPAFAPQASLSPAAGTTSPSHHDVPALAASGSGSSSGSSTKSSPSGHWPPANNESEEIKPVARRRAASAAPATGRFSDFFALELEDAHPDTTTTGVGSPELLRPASNGSGFLQGRLSSQEKEIERLQEKLASLSVLMRATEHEKSQVQAAVEVKDTRIELQQLKIRQLEKLTAQGAAHARELQQVRVRLDEEERAHASCKQQLGDLIAKQSNVCDQGMQTDDLLSYPDENEDELQQRWSVGSNSSAEGSESSRKSVGARAATIMAATIERLQLELSAQRGHVAQLKDDMQDVVSERNSFRAKANELAKEMKKFVGVDRSLADVKTQLADRNRLSMELAVAKAEIKRTNDEMAEYKDALGCMMKQQNMGDKDKATQRILSQNLELQRVVKQLTDSLNEAEEQRNVLEQINGALVQQLGQVRPDMRGSMFESPPGSPHSVMSACANPTFSSDDESDGDED